MIAWSQQVHTRLLHSGRAAATVMLSATVAATGGAALEQPPDASGVTDSTIRIGVESPVGSLSLDGENLGFGLAFDEANAGGGVHGRRFVWTDRRRESGAPAHVLAVARRMIDEDRVFALVNFSGPAIGEIAAYAKAQRVPLLFPHTALVSSEGERYLFTSFPRFEGEAEVMFRYLSETRGLRRLAIAHDPNTYGLLFRDLLQQHAARFGYQVAGATPILSRTPADLSAEFAALTSTTPDAIVMAIYPEQAQALMAARARAGWTGRMVSVGPLTDEASLAVPGGGADGTVGFCHSPDPERSDAPGVVRYRTALSRAHPGRRFDRYTLYGYTFGRLVVAGMERAGRALTRERFIDAMETITNWDAGGVMPVVSLSSSNHHAQRAGFICEMQRGRLVALTDWIAP
jgi:ABC-type branched-subunit amino acid transport system substrate-binding protein